MKAIKIYLFILIIGSCAVSNKQEQRVPASLKFNKTCQNLISKLFGNPYHGEYKLKKMTREQAIKAFNDDLNQRLPNLKWGSRPFLMLHNDDKPRRVALMLHGFSDSPGSMRAVAQMYYDKGFNVFAPLYNDHGLKPPHDLQAMAKTTLKKWRADLDKAAAIAKALSPDGQVDVVAFSLGSSLGWDLSLRFPGLVRTRMLFAPLFREASLAGSVLASPVAWFLNLFNNFFYKDIDATDIFYKAMSYKMALSTHKLLRQLRPNLLTKQDDIPTFIIGTDAETTVDAEYINHVKEVYGIPDERFIIIDNSVNPTPVLHRDVPVDHLNSDGSPNPAIPITRGAVERFTNETTPSL